MTKKTTARLVEYEEKKDIFKFDINGVSIKTKCVKDNIRNILMAITDDELNDGEVMFEIVTNVGTTGIIFLNEVIRHNPKIQKTLTQTTNIPQMKEIKQEDDFTTADKVQNSFEILNKVKCNIQKKGRFNYLSWTDCWREVKRLDHQATFKVYENEQGFPAWIKKDVGGIVKVGVTINNLEHIEHYPITDNYNKTIFTPNVFDINTATKRALVKACAYFGLGLYIYRGDDLPDFDEENNK